MIDEDPSSIFEIYDEELHFNTTENAARLKLEAICNVDIIDSYSLSIWVRLSPNAHASTFISRPRAGCISNRPVGYIKDFETWNFQRATSIRLLFEFKKPLGIYFLPNQT